MDAGRWQRVDELFQAAVEEPPERRGEFLDHACGADTELRAQVERMLAADRDDDFLEAHASAEAARAVAHAARASLVGRRLGPYEILAPLGAGGMGEVYRGRDTRLDRPVAIKVMPAHLAADPEARRRFDHEARAISNLAHPHVCALHDVGREGDVDYLVMELLEGETLAARIERGPVPLADALRWAAQIADALDRAHRAGIVHRDLKPGNVMLTRGGVKLLDFGLARSTAPIRAGSLSGGPTRIAEPLTAEGKIIGTLQYMAPEQLEGRPVDQRADIFAFGAMLYELVTGQRAFAGDSPASVVSAILRDRPPPMSSRVAVAPPALDALVEHCLAKDVQDRWQSAHDLHLQLLAIAAADPARAAPPAVRRGRWLPWAVAALAVALALVAGWQALRGPSAAPPPVVRFELPNPTGGRFYYSVESVTMALSPDGRLLGFVSIGPATSMNQTRIWVRALESLEARPVPGTEGASSVFWSPDGQHVGFVADGKLKRVPIAGGIPVVLCDVQAGAGVSATWGRDSILFSSAQGESIFAVPAGGGGPAVTVLRPDEAHGDLRLVFPWFLPDDQRFLYLAYRADGTSELRLAGPGTEPRTVSALASRVELVDPGHLVFVRDGALLAQAFDRDRAELVGEPIALAPTVRGFGSTGIAAFATSRSGVVAAATVEDVHRLALFDVDGSPLGPLGQPGAAASMALSPDRRRVAVDRLRPGLLTYDVWLLDLDRGVETRLTDGRGTEVYPVWLRGGAAVAYASTRGHVPNVLRRDLATGSETWLTPPSPFQIPLATTPDGSRLLYRQRRQHGFELRSVPVEGGASSPVLPPGVSAIDAAVSSDGTLLAYVAREGGRPECFLRALQGGEVVRVSRDGAWTCRFSPGGDTLFLTTGERRMAAVDVTAEPLGVGAQRELFEVSGLGWIDFEVLADGRFLALVREVDGMSAPLTVIAGWRPPP